MNIHPPISLGAKGYLESFINHELTLKKSSFASFKLEKVQQLLGLMGNPQEGMKIIHIAGSKGKGSTSAMTASILRSAGYRVGLFTSPHINDLRERIRVLDSVISRHLSADIFPDAICENELEQCIEEIKPFTEQMRETKEFGRLSFFEVLTVLALYYFRKRDVDWVVLETGLGGRLDATNAVSTMVCAITPLSLEHTHILGDTVEQIAHEKAGIIKDHCQKVVLAPQEKTVKEILLKRCRQFGIKPLDLDETFFCRTISQDKGKQIVQIEQECGTKDQWELPLLGRHQAVNALTALGIIRLLDSLGCQISSEMKRKGLAEVYWPGRFEIIQENPFIILDGAHNPSSMQMLVETMQEVFQDKKVTVVLGISNDKDKEGICRVFTPIVQKVIFTRADHPRAVDLTDQDLQKLFPGKIIVRTGSVLKAVNYVYEQSKNDEIVLITGSLFMIAEARRICISLKD